MEKESTPHMCDMAGKKEMFEEMRSATRDAKYICSACGRSAAEKERLCRPEELGGGKECGGDCCRGQ